MTDRIIIRQLIREFIAKYCIKIELNDSKEYIDNILKNHEIIEYNEIKYYIPNHNFLFTVDDDILGRMLFATYKV